MIDLTLKKTLNPFKFSAVCADLEALLAKVNFVLGSSNSQNKTHLFISTGKKLVILGYNQDTACSLLVKNAEVEGDGVFSFDPTLFLGVIKKRSLLKFSYTGSVLEFKLAKGNYKGSLVTLPITEEHKTFVNKFLSKKDEAKATKATSIPPELLSVLTSSIEHTAITNIHEPDKGMLNYIQLDEGKLVVSAFDQHHFSMCTTKVKSKASFKIAMPAAHFSIISKVVADNEAKFFFRPEAIRVEGSDYVLSLPASQTTEENFGTMRKYVKALGEPHYAANYSHEKLNTCIENLFTLNSINSNFALGFDDANLSITFSTPNGSATDSIKIKATKFKKPGKISIKPQILRDLLKLVTASPDLQLQIAKQICLFRFTTKKKSTVIMGSALESVK